MMRRHLALGLSTLFLLLFTGCGCTGCTFFDDPLLIPDGGYDYTLSEGCLLGYPIPLVGDNPMQISLQSPDDPLPPAFTYNGEYMQYFRAAVARVPLTMPDGSTAEAPAAVDAHGAVITYFSAALPVDAVLYEGMLDGGAVIQCDGALYQCKGTTVHLICADVGAFFGISPNSRALLFTYADGTLVHYNAETHENTYLADRDVTDAWFVRDPGRDGAAASEAILFCHKGVWHYTDDAIGHTLCVPPNDGNAGTGTQTVYIRGTDYVLWGDNASCYFADAVTGSSHDMDMGGLYKFRGTGVAETLPLSPDGIFVYFYDVDFIYRLNLRTGTLDLAYNEAPMFENTCIINSLVAVTDEIVVLSQKAAEHTEFVATVTIAVFEEDIPDIRHEDDRIDMDAPQ